MKIKINVLILFIVMLTIVISQVAANNEDEAESKNCPDNLALLPAGSEVEYSPFISYGAVTNGSVDTSVLLNLHAYAMNYLQDIYPVSALLDDTMSPMLSDAPVPLVLGENHICVRQNNTTYVFREVTSTEGSGWTFAAIIISPIELTNEVIDEFTVQEFETLQMAPEIVLEAELVLPEEPITMDDKASINDDPIILLAEPTTPILLNAGFYFWKL